jgi:hypothetical protein
MFATAQFLRKRREQWPSNQGDFDLSVVAEVEEYVCLRFHFLIKEAHLANLQVLKKAESCIERLRRAVGL